MEELEPGQVIEYDYRSHTKKYSSEEPLKFCQLNVERGYQLNQIIELLKEIDADIYSLQEIDINNLRSGSADQFKILCKELKVCGGFVVEFKELQSKLRKDKDQGGGYHGNAILSKYDVEFDTLVHKFQPVNWDEEGIKYNEPRIGKIKLKTEILICYCAHFEVFCGIIGRLNQLSEIFEHVNSNANYPYQIILGDLNTMAHTIARLSPKYCKDRYRLLSLGLTEAQFWYNYILNVHHSDAKVNFSLNNWWSGITNKSVLKNLTNPGFIDPFDPNTITLHNPDFWGLYKGKLDWVLYRQFNLLSCSIMNHDFKASDHKALIVQLELDTDFKGWKKKFDKHYAKFKPANDNLTLPIFYIMLYIIIGLAFIIWFL